MKYMMFAIFDVKADAFNTPVFLPTRGYGVREFARQANDERTLVGMYPDDYSFFELGSFDTSKGVLELYETRVSLGVARDFVEVKE